MGCDHPSRSEQAAGLEAARAMWERSRNGWVGEHTAPAAARPTSPRPPRRRHPLRLAGGTGRADSGFDPRAATSLTVHVGTQAPASRPRHLLAERPAPRTKFAAIDRYFAATERSLYVRLDWVRVSTRAPYALAYLSGAEQISVNVLRGAGTSWRKPRHDLR